MKPRSSQINSRLYGYRDNMEISLFDKLPCIQAHSNTFCSWGALAVTIILICEHYTHAHNPSPQCIHQMLITDGALTECELGQRNSAHFVYCVLVKSHAPLSVSPFCLGPNFFKLKIRGMCFSFVSRTIAIGLCLLANMQIMCTTARGSTFKMHIYL